MVSTLQCPECGSSDVEVKNVTGSDPHDEGELECDECGNIEIVRKVDIHQVFR